MLTVFIAFVVLTLIGVPVAFALGISGAIFFVLNPDIPFTVPVQLTVSQTQNFALLAIPLFIMAGNFLNQSGITERMIQLATVLVGRLKGGLAQVDLALSGLMGGVSGSAIADAAMSARMLGPNMIRRGMSKGFVAGIISFSSLLTPVIPPGIGMILYGTVGQVSIGRLFAAGFVPAFLLWAAMAAVIWVVARRRGYDAELAERPTLVQIGSAVRASIWAILFPVFLLLGLRWGVFTPSEVGAFAVVYAVGVGIFAHRALTRAGFLEGLEMSLRDVGSVMFLLSLAAIFSYGIVYEQVPDTISRWVLGVSGDLETVMVIIVLVVIVAGFVIDGAILIVMLTPIFLPLVQSLGGDPVHFGIVFIIAATIGNFTPPVGAAMFAVCTILKVSIADYTRESMPFFVAVCAITLMLVFTPALVLWIPNLLFAR
ncbi:MAG: TRAP transporter large permease [Phreatobacter sp.]|jgi:tripartite ATP-independent transporter DctM subunit|uniref:TRAP transporter large permease n=1 Tax=Phreatobacter sp. TaxID=1966341 RepID=UPI004035513C